MLAACAGPNPGIKLAIQPIMLAQEIALYAPSREGRVFSCTGRERVLRKERSKALIPKSPEKRGKSPCSNGKAKTRRPKQPERKKIAHAHVFSFSRKRRKTQTKSRIHPTNLSKYG